MKVRWRSQPPLSFDIIKASARRDWARLRNFDSNCCESVRAAPYQNPTAQPARINSLALWAARAPTISAESARRSGSLPDQLALECRAKQNASEGDFYDRNSGRRAFCKRRG